jgi:hypothetical protein
MIQVNKQIWSIYPNSTENHSSSSTTTQDETAEDQILPIPHATTDSRNNQTENTWTS